MDLTVIGVVLVLAGVVTTGLIAGFFFGWSLSAVLGLRDVSDHTYVTSMQSINRAILNAVFLVTFMAPLPLLLGGAVVWFLDGVPGPAWWLTGAVILYAVGVLGVTIGGNVPLNDRLRDFDLASASADELHLARVDYESRWNRWHRVRTVAVVAAFVLSTFAALGASG